MNYIEGLLLIIVILLAILDISIISIGSKINKAFDKLNNRFKISR